MEHKINLLSSDTPEQERTTSNNVKQHPNHPDDILVTSERFLQSIPVVPGATIAALKNLGQNQTKLTSIIPYHTISYPANPSSFTREVEACKSKSNYHKCPVSCRASHPRAETFHI